MTPGLFILATEMEKLQVEQVSGEVQWFSGSVQTFKWSR